MRLANSRSRVSCVTTRTARPCSLAMLARMVMIAWPLAPSSGGRLIGENRRWFSDDRSGNCDALLFAAAQIAGKCGGLVREAHAFEDLARFGLGAAALLTADIERQPHILLGRQRRK